MPTQKQMLGAMLDEIDTLFPGARKRVMARLKRAPQPTTESGAKVGRPRKEDPRDRFSVSFGPAERAYVDQEAGKDWGGTEARELLLEAPAERPVGLPEFVKGGRRAIAVFLNQEEQSAVQPLPGEAMSTAIRRRVLWSVAARLAARSE